MRTLVLLFLVIGVANVALSQPSTTAFVTQKMSTLDQQYQFTEKQKDQVLRILIKEENDLDLIRSTKSMSNDIKRIKKKAIEDGTKASLLLIMNEEQRKVAQEVIVQKRIQRQKDLKHN